MGINFCNQRWLNWLPAYCCLLACPPHISAAADGWNIDGEHGELHVSGILSEGAGGLDMKSSHQDVAIDTTFRAHMRAPGDTGLPIGFKLHFHDVHQTYGSQIDDYTGAQSYSVKQPVVTVSFEGEVDDDDPSLIKVNGTRGLALLLRDELGRKVIPGERGEPLFLTPTSDELFYTVSAVRTIAPLKTGHFSAVIRFRVEYD